MNGRLEKEFQCYKKIEAKIYDKPEIIKNYYTSLRANRKSYTSIYVYITNLLHFVRFLYGDNVDKDFYKNTSVSDIERYFISLETRIVDGEEKRVGDDVLQQRWSSLRNFYDFLVKRGYRNNNPINSIDRPSNQTEHKVVYLTKAELNKLFKAIDENPSLFMSTRDKAVISLGLSTGMRVSAIVNINIDDIDFSNNVIKVIEKRKKVREISIGDNTKQQLQKWINIRNEIFPDIETDALFVSQKKSRLSTLAANDALKRYCEKAGINKHITMHKLRSSAACTLAKNNIPVKAIAQQLGHSSIKTTMRYLDVFNEDIEKSKNILDNLF